MQKQVIRQYLQLFAVAIPVILVDQVTKALLRSRLAMGESWPADGWLVFLFKFVRTTNTGAAFSMGSGLGPLFMLLAIAAVLVILYYYPRLPTGEPLLHFATGLLLGGAAGNLIDRLTVGQVTDFIAIRFFAVVNVADICLTFGTALVILWMILKERQSKRQAAE